MPPTLMILWLGSRRRVPLPLPLFLLWPLLLLAYLVLGLIQLLRGGALKSGSRSSTVLMALETYRFTRGTTVDLTKPDGGGLTMQIV